MWRGIVDEYRDRFPVLGDADAVTLHEGNTPLVPARRLSSILERPTYFKVEGANPTGSFKDRGMTVAVTAAVEAGARAVACASTGNTSASAAAYAARARLDCIVVLPAGKVARGKLAQAIRHGARVVQIEGSFDDALRVTIELAEEDDTVLVNSLNPHRLLGQQSVAWEIVDQLGDAPEVHALPVGNAGNITATWAGYEAIGESPRMWGFQAAGAAPIVEGAPVEDPETVATAIRIGHPASWKGAIAARDESNGMIGAVSDEQILSAYTLLASEEGLFVEPASAAAVAGLIANRDRLPVGRVVVTLTGHGLKDPDVAVESVEVGAPVRATVDAVREELQKS